MTTGHFIDFNDLSMADWDELYTLGYEIRKRPGDFAGRMRNRVLAALFYEPSTRTMLSFQTAMLRLGGQVIAIDDPNTSSVSKGESLSDTVRIIGCYSDIIVIRSPLEGAAMAASLYSEIPIINAGDGGHLHPTQTLTDLFTLQSEKGKLTGMKIGVCGDLKYGRTVHSLLKALTIFGKNTFYLISTPELALPEYIKDHLRKQGNDFIEVSSLEECIGELDVLYMTRIQKERFDSVESYQKQKGVFCLDTKKMKSAPADMIVLHPLPKVDEIEPEVDYDSRSLYFRQAKNGMYIRMALIIRMIENGCISPVQLFQGKGTTQCTNPKCITRSEAYLPSLFKGSDDETVKLCRYCDHDVM